VIEESLVSLVHSYAYASLQLLKFAAHIALWLNAHMCTYLFMCISIGKSVRMCVYMCVRAYQITSNYRTNHQAQALGWTGARPVHLTKIVFWPAYLKSL